jgi:flagellar biosynthesis protein FlhG
MRWHGRLSHQEYGRLLSAALTLFGPRKVSEDNFWQTLTQENLKQAFREKAKCCHPDLNGGMRPATMKAAQERFIVVKDSYEVLKRFLGTDLFRTLDG